MPWTIDTDKALRILNNVKFPLGPINWTWILSLIKHCVKRTSIGPKMGKDKQIEVLEDTNNKLREKIDKMRKELAKD